jgi:hypothetical protein
MEHRPSATERRMRRLSGRRTFSVSRLRRRWILVFAALVAALGLWTAYDLRAARNELLSSRAELASAASNLGGATDAQTAATLRKATRLAVTRTRDADARVRRSPVLRLAALVPVLNTQRDGLVRAARTARDAAVIGDRLAAVAQREADKVSVHNGSVDLAALQALAQAAQRASEQLHALRLTHRDAQWGPLGHATTDLDRLLVETQGRLAHGAGVMKVAADLLGAQGPKRVFIALLNNAEMRDQGMVLSYAVVETADGGFRVTRSGSVLDIPVAHAVPDPPLPAGTQKIFGSLQPNHVWQSVNATADTTLSGALIRAMYEQATGDRVDGVVALDVPTLAALLSVTGPVQVAGIAEPITAENATRVLLNDLYAAATSYRDPNRLEQLAATLDAVVNKIETSSLNGAGLVRALGTAARGGHTWVSTANAAGQQALVRAGLGGSPARTHPERTIHLSVQNGTATKLDYFVDPKVDVSVALTPDGSAVVTTTVRLPNTAPVPTPAGEQFGPDGFVTTVAGFYRGRVYFWGPAGADQVDSVEESGLRLNFAVTDVPAGKTGTVSFTTVIPRAVRDGVLRLRFVPQGRVRPMHLRVRVAGVGWKVLDPAASVDWDRTVDLSWRVRSR